MICKKCKICNIEFTSISNSQKYCSKNCLKQSRLKLCSICNKIKSISTTDDCGKPICHNCNRKLKSEKCCLCSKIGLVFVRNNNGVICSNCYSKSQIGQCPICRENKRLINRSNNKKICKNCFNKLKEKEMCPICKKISLLCNRDQNNKHICSTCYSKNKPKELCSICNKIKHLICLYKNNQYICLSCYRKNKPKELCSICNKITNIKYKKLGKENICNKCYSKNRKKEICFKCGTLKFVESRHNGYPICQTCYRKEKPDDYCDICCELKKIRNRKNGRKICNNCYSLSRLEKCYICQKIKRISCMNFFGHPICLNCYKLMKRFDNNIDILQKYIKSKISFHHLIFEEIFNNFYKEYSISKLIYKKIFEKCDSNFRTLRYDYFFEKEKILIEINEPLHYSEKEYIKKYPSLGKSGFDKYCYNFATKIQLAKDNNIKLIIIDIEYNMSYEELKKLYRDKVIGQESAFRNAIANDKEDVRYSSLCKRIINYGKQIG